MIANARQDATLDHNDLALPFESTRPLLLFDYFRVPYEITLKSAEPDVALLRVPGRKGPLLAWCAHPREAAEALRLEGMPVHASVVGDDRCETLVETLPGQWTTAEPLIGPGGVPRAHVWRSEDGGVFLPFNPDEAIRVLWSESYQELTTRRSGQKALAFARQTYYRIRPALPRPVQIGLRRRFSRIQARTTFPAWPVEAGLHDLYGWLFSELCRISDAAIPILSVWPRNYEWALVLTHDVETAYGYENITPLCDLEIELGYRSSWNLVPRRYDIQESDLRLLSERGFEIGVHGLYHDGRDLGSRETFERRLPAIREYADRWQAVGFRSPATHRVWSWMPRLGFEYDTSYPDSDPFEPQAGGCCTWLPFMNDDLVELPITMAQDHTIFVILQQRDEQAWVEKVDFLRRRGGMALLITHPDYMMEEERQDAYRRLLTRYADDPSAWKALPRSVSSWWRRRADSSIELGNDGWHVTGPASDEAVVRFVSPGVKL